MPRSSLPSSSTRRSARGCPVAALRRASPRLWRADPRRDCRPLLRHDRDRDGRGRAYITSPCGRPLGRRDDREERSLGRALARRRRAAARAAGDCGRARKGNTRVLAPVPSPCFPATPIPIPTARSGRGPTSTPTHTLPSQVLDWRPTGALAAQLSVPGQQLAAEHASMSRPATPRAASCCSTVRRRGR